METEQIKDDLELKYLDGYTGSEGYHKIQLYPNINLTDGIGYVMNNGYSWFITDMLAVISILKEEEFLSIKLKINKDKTATAEITDGNEKVLYTQGYEWTDAKINLNLFFTNNVMMLSQEY